MSDRENQPGAPTNADLELLMVRYQKADPEAVTQLADHLSRKLLPFFWVQVRNHHEAEDLLQECWLRIHKARHTYRKGEPVLPWVFAIARHTQVDRYRKQRRVSAHELPSDRVPDIAADSPISSPQAKSPSLTELLRTLPPQQRETVLLLKVSGLSLEEVARATNTTVGAVKQRAYRAYTKLRQLFGVEQ